MRNSEKFFGRALRVLRDQCLSRVQIITIGSALIMLIGLVWLQSSSASSKTQPHPTVEDLNNKLDKLNDKVEKLNKNQANKIEVINKQQQLILEKQELKDKAQGTASTKENSKEIDLRTAEVNDLRAELMTLQPDIKALKEDLEPKNKVLEAQINTIGEQQQNFVSGVIWILGLFTLGNLLKDYIIKNAEIQDLKSIITKELENGLQNINEESMRKIKTKQLLLDYQTAVLAAERLEYDYINTKEVYLCISAICERLRAIQILAELKKNVELDTVTNFHTKQLFNFIQSDIEKNCEIVKQVSRNSKEKINHISHLIDAANIYEILHKIADEEYKNKTQKIINELHSLNNQ
ncbi:hypothetical protein [Scytonema sp. PCC 10023]|uniref:hypothetical protein n=1 Tax=Scytonema sp. PCC 10023 TaxID=1680591 RepID=UPI0039C6C123